MSLSYRVEQDDGTLGTFSRDRLFLSVAQALEHRSDHIEDSGKLILTILENIHQRKRLVITRSELVDVVATTLRRFDVGCSQIYRSRHPIR
jgi:transcriptional regulator NrdR family protein